MTKADANLVDSRQCTALHWAAKAASRDTVAVLLAAGVSPSTASKAGSTPLHLACEAAAPPCVAMLLRAKAAVEAADSNGVTALHAASASGNAECVQLLLAQGANPNAALDISGKLQMSGSETERHSKAPLYLAAEKGHTASVRALLEAGADVHAPAVTTTGAQPRATGDAG